MERLPKFVVFIPIILFRRGSTVDSPLVRPVKMFHRCGKVNIYLSTNNTEIKKSCLFRLKISKNVANLTEICMILVSQPN